MEDFDLINEDFSDDPTNGSDTVNGLFDNPTKQYGQSIATSPSFEDDPNGGVIVTDIFGGRHHYMDKEQAEALTDFISGLPTHTSAPMSTAEDSSDGCLPTDFHTPTDLSFYDDKLADAQERMNKALEDASHTKNEAELKDAMSRQRQAENDIQYWESYRSQEEYNQTIQHQKSDRIINDCNDALNRLHNILHDN